MKTCNNCGTNNEMAEVKCVGCNMPGNFTLHKVYDDDLPETESQKIQCSNCASFHPGTGINCQHCHFPLKQMRVKAIPKPALHLYRKVG